MASKKVRQKISYVLEIDPQSVGHRLGVNGLAYDSKNSILYSGGRDGVVCAWDIHLDQTKARTAGTADSAPTANGSSPPAQPATAPASASPARQTATSRAQTQAHMHWINDIALALDNSVLVTASSDLLVKAWRPRLHGDGGSADQEPVIVGRHQDYAKCVASPGQQATWVASGGLDRRIRLWDLRGGSSTNEILEIDVSGEERAEKGSVYALGATHSLLASGGPESTVRLWDPRTGKNITKFVGHTDNVRAILISASGERVLTASADQTVKVWSVSAGRCMHTLTMHNDSIWSLYADRLDLGVFYSGDRSGLVVKTDVRGCLDDMDAGLSVAVAQEHGGVSKIVASDGYIWTATSSSSVNRWTDIETESTLQSLRQQQKQQKQQKQQSEEATLAARPFSPASTVRPHSSSVSTVKSAGGGGGGTSSLAPPGLPTLDIPLGSILRISNTATFPARVGSGGRKGSVAMADDEAVVLEDTAVEPIQRLPVETIEGTFGLVKHRLLNDRRRVLTLDTAGEVVLWDLIQCKPLRRFGKRHLEDVEPEVNTTEAVAPWCSVDVSSGNLMVVLDAYNCFDAEIYADELVLDEPIVDGREDQRINLGKWILHYLFKNLVDEEVRRDDVCRAKLNAVIDQRIELAAAKAAKAAAEAAAAAAAAEAARAAREAAGDVRDSSTAEEGTEGKRTLELSRGSAEREEGAVNRISSVEAAISGGRTSSATDAEKPGDKAEKEKAEKAEKADKTEKTEKGKEKGKSFGKKLRMGMSFGTKKLGRSASTSVPDKQAGTAEGSSGGGAAGTGAGAGAGTAAASGDGQAAEEGSEAGSAAAESDLSFAGVVQRMRAEYERQAAAATSMTAEATALVRVESKVTPCPAEEAPLVRLPANTTVIIQEELQGGSMEVYRGTVGTAGRERDVDKIERCAPRWLAEALLLNSVAAKESFKVSFVLLPFREEGETEAQLPTVATPDGNSRLNANRMLRVKKILVYVAEKIEGVEGEKGGAEGEKGEKEEKDEEKKEEKEGEKKEEKKEEQTTEKLRPEEYLDLYCNDQRLPELMSLATVRAHIWKNSSDIVLYYRANGRKEIRPKRVSVVEEKGEETEA